LSTATAHKRSVTASEYVYTILVGITLSTGHICADRYTDNEVITIIISNCYRLTRVHTATHVTARSSASQRSQQQQDENSLAIRTPPGNDSFQSVLVLLQMVFTRDSS